MNKRRTERQGMSRSIRILLPEEHNRVNGNRTSYLIWLARAAVLACAAMLVTACGSGTAHFTIEAKDNLTFTPDTISVKTGQTVELTLVNRGKLDHTFSVPDLNIEVQLPAGQTDKIVFTAPRAGEYPFSSGVIRDFETMKGKLIVK
jgi:plastocyanin